MKNGTKFEKQESDRSPIFSILPDRSSLSFSSDDDLHSGFSNWSNHSNTTASAHHSSNNMSNLHHSLVPVIPPTITTSPSSSTSTNTNATNSGAAGHPNDTSNNNNANKDSVDHNRQLLILALLEKVSSLNDATPRTFAIHVLHFLEKQVLDPSTVRYLFDYHGLIPKHWHGNFNNNNQSTVDATNENQSKKNNRNKNLNLKGNSELNTVLTLQQERDIQMALLRQYFLSQSTAPPTTTTTARLSNHNIPTNVQSIPFNNNNSSHQLQLHPNLFSLQNHPLLTSRFQRDFHFIQPLSSGSFGSVYHVQNKLDAADYALKQIYFQNKGFEQHTIDLVLREIKCLAQLNHSHCVRYYSSWLEPCWNSNSNFTTTTTTDSYGDTMGEIFSTSPPKTNMLALQNDVNENSSVSKDDFIIYGKSWKSQHAEDSLASFGTDGEESEYSEWSQDLESTRNNGRLSRTSQSRSYSKSSSYNHHAAKKNNQLQYHQKQTQTKKNTTSTFYYQICLYIQMELCNLTTLADWIHRRNHSSHASDDQQHHHHRLKKALTIMTQIASGLEHVHSKHIIHRDLKPANIFACRNNPDVFKIGDFGLSKSISPSYTASSSSSDWNTTTTTLDADIKAKQTLGIGTASYASPEQMSSSTYSAKSDIFSLGLIFLELIGNYQTAHERAHAFHSIRKERKVVLSSNDAVVEKKSNRRLWQKIQINHHNDIDSSTLTELKKLIVEMTVENPKRRLAASDVLNIVRKQLIQMENSEMECTGSTSVGMVKQFKNELKNKDDVIATQKSKIEEMEEIICKLKKQLEVER